MNVPRILPERSALLIVDIQERILPVIANGDQVRDKAAVVVKTAKALEVPVFLTEQYPKGLGRTVPELREVLRDAYRPFEKVTFSSYGAEELRRVLSYQQIERVWLVGIEAHICVLQTALDLIEGGLHVFAVADAISSRHMDDRTLGFQRMQQSGVMLTSTEMLIFELLKSAEHSHFRYLQSLIR